MAGELVGITREAMSARSRLSTFLAASASFWKNNKKVSLSIGMTAAEQADMFLKLVS
jgi:hypothetical protein